MLEARWSLLGAKIGVVGANDYSPVRPAGTPSFEPLEPRLLLSVDPIGSQSLVPLETSLAGHAILVDLTRVDEGQQESLSPILTIDLPASNQTREADATSSDDLPTDANLNESGDLLADETLGADIETNLVDENLAGLSEAPLRQAGCHVVTQVEPSGSPALLQNDSTGPAVPDQQDIVSGPEILPVGIRGPPAADFQDLSVVSSDSYSIVTGSCETTTGEGTPIRADGIAPDLPGLRLVDPDISNWQGQIIYLDFDGEQNVTYHGPVTVGPFDVPAFQAPGELAGQEQAIIAEGLLKLERLRRLRHHLHR